MPERNRCQAEAVPGSNLVSPKHYDLLEMSTEDAVMELFYHLQTIPTQLFGKQLFDLWQT
jgi:hypothetical protein